ncbi:unnamed protein product, partial [Scytosiphon promiscuus]
MMLPRAVGGKLPAIGLHTRPLSTHKTWLCRRAALAAVEGNTSTPTANGNRNIKVHAARRQPHPHTSRYGPGAGAARPRRHRWRHPRQQFSSGRGALAPSASPEVAREDGEEEEEEREGEVNGRGRGHSDSSPLRVGASEDDSIDLETVGDLDPTPPAAVGLRPETGPASTPLDLGCKAYYMARNIGIKTVCTRLYAGFPRSFEKHCVVIGPLDPNCFEAGSYPSPRDPAGGLDGVLRDLSLSKLKNKNKGGKKPL